MQDDASQQPEDGAELAQSGDDLQPADYYFDGPYLVFTEAYHLRRGRCCNSGCRHCPWRSADSGKA